MQPWLRKGTDCQSRVDKPKTPQFSDILELQFVKDRHNSEILVREDNKIENLHADRTTVCFEP